MGFQSSINTAVGAVLGTRLLKANPHIQKMDMAQKQLQQRQEAKKKQKRNFKEYIGNMTVSSLSPAMQQQVASEYNTPYKRKKLMDQQDEMAKGGK